MLKIRPEQINVCTRKDFQTPNEDTISNIINTRWIGIKKKKTEMEIRNLTSEIIIHSRNKRISELALDEEEWDTALAIRRNWETQDN